MTMSYADVEKQIATLKAKAEALKAKEVAGVIAKIKLAVERYQLTAADLGLGPGSKARRASVARPPAGRKRASPAKGRKLGKVPVKHRDKSGSTWTGRGNQPVWLREAIKVGAKLENFRV